MSRFYEALRQAGRSLRLTEGAEAEASDFSAILNDAEVSEAADPAEPPALPAEENLVVPSEQFLPPAATPQNGSIGLPTEAVLDKRTRLITNSVEPGILEHYRQLRTKIMQQRTEKMFQALLVASADPKEGKTITVLNLALTFSMLPSFRVLVVDGDIRLGHMSKWLGTDGRPGLSNLLEGSQKLNEVVLNSAEIPFCFMTRGNSKLPPPELLHSSRWANQVKKMREHFDLILVDSPAVRLVTDAQLLASGCEAVLLVARSFHSSREALQKVSRDFQQFRVIGVVLNGGQGFGSYRRYPSYSSGERG